ncbi:sulfatase-like hydrolase/transferase [Microbaculum marinum]|uniref:Sulfatase-like hydrolase/transferase n=1 Tax=Microbaculum marinum TaxID=1764581 RepID=A0AAW9S2I6_9HYPH
MFIIVDDMNNWPTPYSGHPDAYTPSMEEIAEAGFRLNGISPSPACSSARTAIFSGISPSTSGVYGNHQSIFDLAKKRSFRTLPGLLRARGMYVGGAGKIFHHSVPNRKLDLHDWDEYWLPKDWKAKRFDQGYRRSEYARQQSGAETQQDWGVGEYADLHDNEVTDWAVARLAAYRKAGRRFALFVGLTGPHLPIVAGQRYHDMVPDHPSLPPQIPANLPYEDAIQRDLADVPDAAFPRRQWFESEIYQGLVEYDEYEDFLRAYLAVLARTDENIGRLFDAYNDLGFDEDTLFVVTSDHGFHLGSKGKFSKFTLWQESLQVPLLLVSPNLDSGIATSRPVSLLDLYPTVLRMLKMRIPDWVEGANHRKKLINARNVKKMPVWAYFDDNGQSQLRSAVIDGRRKVIYNRPGREVYKLSNDPYELTNIASSVQGY